MIKRTLKKRVSGREVYELGWHSVESGQLGCFWRLSWEEFVFLCYIKWIKEAEYSGKLV